MVYIIVVVAAMVNIGAVWSIFSIKAHVEKQSSILTTQTLLMAKMAKQSGVSPEEVNELIGALSKQL